MKICPSAFELLHILEEIKGLSDADISCAEKRHKGIKEGRQEATIQILSHIFQPAHTT
jgi:hypothetical protein